jgi:hypothetical protein
MRKAARHSDNVDSPNPRRWRGERLHHHGDGVCWLFVLLWMDLGRHKLIVCKKWYKNNLKMRLTHYFLIHVGVHHTIHYHHVSSFSTVITNHFIGEELYLSPNSQDGDEAKRFDVTQLTQDEEQSLFTIKTNMPIPMLVYGDSFH